MSWHAEENFEQHPYQDASEHLIENHGGDLTQDQKASLWDDYHAAKTPAELVQRLQNHNVPNQLKHELLQAKQITAPVPSLADKVTDAIHRMSRLDPETLAVAEKHPTIAKAFLDAATKNQPVAKPRFCGEHSEERENVMSKEPKQKSSMPELSGLVEAGKSAKPAEGAIDFSHLGGKLLYRAEPVSMSEEEISFEHLGGKKVGHS